MIFHSFQLPWQLCLSGPGRSRTHLLLLFALEAFAGTPRRIAKKRIKFVVDLTIYVDKRICFYCGKFQARDLYYLS